MGGLKHGIIQPMDVSVTEVLNAGLFSGVTGSAQLRRRLSAPELAGETLSEPMDKGFLVSGLRDEADAARVSTLMRIIQELGGYLVDCPPEIAWRRGMIGKEKLKEAAELFPEYGAYLDSLLQ